MAICKKIINTAIIALSVLIICPSWATNIVLDKSKEHANEALRASFAAGEGAEADILVPEYKNAEDVSVTNFHDFTVANEPLYIYNGIKDVGKTISDDSDSAEVIVLIADNIDLSNKIEIVGKPAALLILSRNITTSCQGCSFKNASRVTIANANVTYTNSGSVNTLQVVPNGMITVNGLTAPGANALDLIASNVNLSGVIDTNLRADNHPKGGMIITENGSKIVGSGGVYIYPGQFTLKYSDYKLVHASQTGSHEINADINAAYISVISPDTITIPASTKLNTTSDALASSSYKDKFSLPLEGIQLATVSNENADIISYGTLLSDNKVSLTALRNVTLTSSSVTVSNALELLADKKVENAGIQQVTDLTASAEMFVNTGAINAKAVVVEADKDIFNSFGGMIQSDAVTLHSVGGSVVNGSRSKYIDYKLPNVTLARDDSAGKWGIKADAPLSGTTSSRLSAHILANDIFINATKFENINSYYENKPESANWDSGMIPVDTRSANRVSVQAEKTLHIKASSYVLNSSAILALNQNGDFQVNTPYLSNERYSLAVNWYKFEGTTLKPDSKQQVRVTESGYYTQITQYSPPGRLYSFGPFKYSSGEKLASTKFVNEYSYVEMFDNSYFYQTQIDTIGIKVSKALTTTETHGVRSCMIYNRCYSESSQMETHAEAETLLSFVGNVYGIDNTRDSVSQSEVVADSETQAAAIHAIIVDAEYDNRSGFLSVGEYQYSFDHTIEGTLLKAYYKKCTDELAPIDLYKSTENEDRTIAICETVTIETDVAHIVGASTGTGNDSGNSNGSGSETETNEPEPGLTSYTVAVADAQVREEIRKYIEGIEYDNRQGTYNTGKRKYHVSESVHNDQLTVVFKECNTTYNTCAGISNTSCTEETVTKPLDYFRELLVQNSDYIDSGYTDEQLKTAAIAYIGTLAIVNSNFDTSSLLRVRETIDSTSFSKEFVSFTEINESTISIKYREVLSVGINLNSNFTFVEEKKELSGENLRESLQRFETRTFNETKEVSISTLFSAP